MSEYQPLSSVAELAVLNEDECVAGYMAGLASTLAPTIVAQKDEGRVRAMLQDEFARALESASNHFARLSASAGGAP